MIKREYYNNGELWAETKYHKGQKHGISKAWYIGGQPMCECLYHEGQLHGIDRWWYNNGKLIYKHYYLYDNKVTEKEYKKHELIKKLSGL